MKETVGPTIRVNRAPSPMDSDMVDATERRQTLTEARRAQREAIHQEHRSRSASTAVVDADGFAVGAGPAPPPPAAPSAEAAPVKPAFVRDLDLDSVEVPLPDGRTVLLRPPAGISLTMRVERLLSARGMEASTTEREILRTLMCVAEVAGKKIDPVVNDIQASAVANLIGDLGLERLNIAYAQSWPPLMRSELGELKKNHRGRNVH